MKKTVFFSLGLMLLAVGLGAAFLYSGIYPIGANQIHFPLEVKLINILKSRALARSSREMTIPPDFSPASVERLQSGLKLYQKNCQFCHGGPGVKGQEMVLGLNPSAPPLFTTPLSDRELAWVIKNGLKFTGMPAFGLYLSAEEIWDLTAFVKRLSTLSPKQYQKMISPDTTRENIRWKSPTQGYKELTKRGNAERGKTLIKQYGCNTCHVIPGTVGPQGHVGPDLHNFARQHFIAGHLINNPINLVTWLRSPQDVEMHTAMPDLKLSSAEAWDIAKFLYRDLNSDR